MIYSVFQSLDTVPDLILTRVIHGENFIRYLFSLGILDGFYLQYAILLSDFDYSPKSQKHF